MKKIALNVDELTVNTFETAAADGPAGTVEAYARTKAAQYTCDPAVGTCFGYTCIDACF